MSQASISTCFLAFCLSVASAAPARAQESAEERYQFIAGLCDERQFELAVTEARAFLSEHARHPKAELARYRLACALYELGRREEARPEFTELAKRSGFEFAAEVAFRLGQCELAANRPAAAASAFERVRGSKAEYLLQPATFFLGEARLQQGDFAAAEAAFGEVDPQGEYGREARAGLAWSAHKRGQHERASELAAQFLAADAEHALADEMCFILGEAELARGNARDALTAYSAVREGEFSEPALRGSAFASAALGEHAQAARLFGRLLERFPEGRHAPEAALQRGVELVRAGEARAAVEALGSPRVARTAEASFWLGRAQLDAGDARAALAAFDAALKGGANAELAERLHVARGDALSKLGRAEDAAGAYARSKSEAGMYGAAIAAHNAGRAEEAGSLARGLLTAHPKTQHAVQMQLVVGESEFAAKRYDEAERAFRAVLEGAQESSLRARAAARIGWCCYMREEFAVAARAFTEAVARDAGSEEAHYMRGVCAEKAGDKATAGEAWRGYVERFEQGSHRADALLGLARVEANSSRWLEQLASEDPDGDAAATALFELAEQAAKNGEREGAIERYRDFTRRFPRHALIPNARYGLAWGLYESERFDESARELAPLLAEDALDDQLKVAAAELGVWARAKAQDADGALAAYRSLLQTTAADARKLAAARIAAKALVDAGRAPAAQGVYDELLGHVSERATVRESLIESAWLALDAKHPDDAEAAVRTALKFGLDETTKPKLAEASFFVGEARYDAGEDERALELYRVAAEQGTADIVARALYKQGFAHLRRNEIDLAAQCFARVAEQHREHELGGESLYLLGEARFRGKQWELAIAPLERLRTEQPRHASLDKALFRLGVANGELGRWEACSAALSELARRNGNFEQAAEADLWRGRAQAHAGDARGARATFERLVTKDRTVIAARARLELGKLAAAAGEHERALADFLKVALLYANENEVAEASLLAAGELEALGQLERARERYRELVERQPKSEFARRARERLAQLDAR